MALRETDDAAAGVPPDAHGVQRILCRRVRGPWITDYNKETGTRKVIGNTGGYNGGGNDANVHWITYAPVYGKDAQDLFDDAKAHRQPGEKPPYVSAVLPGAADTWKHAKLMASGNFVGTGHSDLLVVCWTHATLLTSGEFSGNSKWDLMVRWSDGELDTYVGTTTKALGTEARILNANDLWTHDTVMTTGNYTANGRTDDLVIRWSDGETTMYTDTKTNRLGTERMLVAPPT
ncbi:hypothetical protein [Streptomyces sp. NPDC003077]|uniref:hypothetical protein n=1 Tax=Streptomyces sp. NPDC003077 TaxID=3154443 RepID=UPI0033A4DCCD